MPTALDNWGCSHTCVLILFTGAVAGLFALSWGVSQEPKDLANIKKTFGLGVGPSYLDTFDVVGEDLKNTIYEEYFAYKKLTRQISEEETANYKKWYAGNECLAGCPSTCSVPFTCPYCKRGICWCTDKNPSTYGQCRTRKVFGDAEKYRKPALPPLPDFCYIRPHVLDDLQAHKPECQHKVEYPNVFDLETQTCDVADPGSCLDRDMNLICGETGTCQCRQDMRWNVDRMQCEVYLGVDCSDVSEVDMTSGSDYKKEKDFILGHQLFLPSTELDEYRVKTAYCNILEQHSKQHIKQKRGGREENSMFAVPGVIFFGAGCAFGFMWLLMIFGICRAFIRSFDPRNELNDMSNQDKIAALAAVAGQEMVERQQEKEDERRVALMQGQGV
eukprot:GFUD01007333.1.p1 GENE.GFUD01007333.1~~GFUD01007333.1.p1  ORF type:complete len:388 (+),score=83.00 GFUD01007333.1:150-1313(+)